MKDSSKSTRPRPRVKSRSNLFLYTVCASMIFFATIFYFYTKEKPVNAHSNDQQIITDKVDDSLQKGNVSLQNNPETSPQISPEITLQAQLENSTRDTSSPLSLVEKADPSLSSIPSIDKSTENNVNPLIQHLNEFYEHLDQQQYMKEFNFHRPSKDHFSTLLQNLINSPPVVTDETNDLFTLLKNTAHFFRILGKENIVALKGILDREKASFEDILKTFYALTKEPEALKEEYDLTISESVLYDYAGFFLNTMGGRLYLFRRDSASRLTVSFYAIQIIDKANIEGYNRHGINLIPAIDFLINEMENTGKNLLLKDDYLDTLYDLKEKYN
jgi:hypothetical protein